MALFKDNPAAAVVVIVLALGAAVFMFTRGSEQPAGNQDYYYDLTTGEMFVAPRQSPPIKSDAGNDAVRANVYSCGACEASQWFIGTIETYVGDPDKIENHRVAALPAEKGGKPIWVTAVSNEAGRISAELLKKCDGDNKPTVCLP